MPIASPISLTARPTSERFVRRSAARNTRSFFSAGISVANFASCEMAIETTVSQYPRRAVICGRGRAPLPFVLSWDFAMIYAMEREFFPR